MGGRELALKLNYKQKQNQVYDIDIYRDANMSPIDTKVQESVVLQ